MAERERPVPGPGTLAGHVLLGVYFGLVLAKSEAISWFRIQEMFRFQSFHMYGLIGSAVVTAMVSIAVLRRAGAAALSRESDVLADKEKTPGLIRYWAGGSVFGLGWALLGACPGPLYVLVGYGATVYLLALGSALLGTIVYGAIREHLPH